jgi:hypothetical protein
MNTRGSLKPNSDHASSLRGRFSLSNLPIKYRLPLIVGAILFGIILSSIWASYRSVKEAALAVGRDDQSAARPGLSCPSFRIVLNEASPVE